MQVLSIVFRKFVFDKMKQCTLRHTTSFIKQHATEERIFIRCKGSVKYSEITFDTSCHYSILVSDSMAICKPSLKSYSNIASSERLAYSLQQSWNFSKISFCSSVIVFIKSSRCRAIYSTSSFISGELVLLSSCGAIFPCHSSFIILFIVRTFCQHTTILQKFAEVQTSFENKNTFSLFFDYRDAIFDLLFNTRKLCCLKTIYNIFGVFVDKSRFVWYNEHT